MIRDVSTNFPKGRAFTMELMLEQLEGKTTAWGESYPTNPNLYKAITGSYPSLDDFLESHSSTQIEGNNMYITGSPSRGYHLSFEAGKRPIPRQRKGKEAQTHYKWFANIVFKD